MEELQQCIIHYGLTDQMKEEERSLHEKWEGRAQQEEKLWQQRSQICWLRCGERNSSFFHHSMIRHKKNNTILNLKSRDGGTVNTHEDISTELNDFYSNHLEEP